MPFGLDRNHYSIFAGIRTNSSMTASQMAKEMGKSSQYVGRVMTSLVEKKLISIQRDGRDKFYEPAIDAIIAYANPNQL
ncbi:helix-turn-helix domain-containing protein [Candidatus Finniella inopinata]|uniref:MarR family transcriptional regulator n=1 Tax=Candidatus Finniella inopinata TaxID=1696036 RepID=UPI0030B978ED